MVSDKYRQMQAQFESWVEKIPDIRPDLVYKGMFGGVLVYTMGKPFAIFWDDRLGLKLPENEQAAIREEGANDAGYDSTTPGGKQYITLPPSILSDEKKITYWIEDSIRYVQTLMPAKKKKK